MNSCKLSLQLQWNFRPSEKRTASLERTAHDVPKLPFPIAIITSERRTLSLKWTKRLVPKCPLFGGSNISDNNDCEVGQVCEGESACSKFGPSCQLLAERALAVDWRLGK